MIDLTAAVEAAARGMWDGTPGPAGFDAPWEKASPLIKHDVREAALLCIAAAAPLIGEAIAQAIEANLAEHALCDVEFDAGYQFASEVAATIAREVTR